MLTSRGTTCSTGKVASDSSVEIDKCSQRSDRAVSWAVSSSDCFRPAMMLCSTQHSAHTQTTPHQFSNREEAGRKKVHCLRLTGSQLPERVLR